MKKIFLLALIASITALAALPIAFAQGENESIILTAEVLNLNESTVYHVFDEPSDIEYSDGEIYIRSKAGYEIFDGSTFSKCDISADSIAVLDGGIATLSDGKLCYGTKSEGEYSVISAYKNTLYAAQGNKISKFKVENGDLIPDGDMTAVADVIMMAATDSGCMYAVARTGYTDIYLNEDRLTLTGDKVLDLAYLDGKYYILTANDILMYTDLFLAPVTQPATRGALAITVGDGIYLLSGTGTIVRYTPDLSLSEPIVASSGELDWFYTTPVNVDTKLKNILVTDRSLGTGTGLGRVAVISDDKIEYISELNTPMAATADIRGNIYVAHSGNKVAIYSDKDITDELSFNERIVDIEVDIDGNLYCLAKSGNVLNANGTVLRENVRAMKFQSTMHFMTDEYIDDIPLSAADFALDVMGNIFAVNGNKIIAIVDGKQTEYTVSNADKLIAIAISKVETDSISYGDLILIDETNMCVLTIDGSLVGSTNAKLMFTPPALTETPNVQATGLIGKTDGTMVFSLPLEGEIVYEAKAGENVILLKDGLAPEPFIYCAIDTLDQNGEQKLILGYIYKSTIEILDYYAPKYHEAKINANNTPVYKYPSVNSPKIAEYSKNTMIAILPFAATYPEHIQADSLYSDVWYNDAYDYKWYRISLGTGEGYIVATNADVNIFSNEIEMPQPNATIKDDAELYRYDKATDSYIKFESLGIIDKDTRVRVEVPYGASNEYTKIVFYREGLGVIDADCFVETRFVDFDGVDLVQIIAICVIVLAVIILIIVIIRRYKYRRLNRSRLSEPDLKQ